MRPVNTVQPSHRIRHPELVAVLAALAIAAGAQTLAAQVPPPRAPFPGRADERAAAEAILASFERAQAAKDALAARRFAWDALAYCPEDGPLLLAQLAFGGAAAEGLDPAAAAFLLAQIGPHAVGRLPARKDRAFTEHEAWLAPVLAGREKLIATLLTALDKNPGPRESAAERTVRRWQRELLAELLWARPGLRAAAFDPKATSIQRPDHRPIFEGLKRVMDRALGQSDFATAIRIARCLQAFAAQAGFHDLYGPDAPDLRPVRMAATKALADARAGLAKGRNTVLPTIEELLLLDGDAKLAFDRDHADWSHPGVTLSPSGLYRIETTCGLETLLGVATTIEAHHRRLVAHYGKDPFEGRPGLVRVDAHAHGLESEGTPHWWAAGFQSGDVTTVQFASGTIEGLGRTLTHELTHRFDGAIYGGLPGWLAEGRAVWTGGAYGHSSDERFAERWHDVGRTESAFIKGYGGREKLEQLLQGTIEDYRDNYVAGYALWMFLQHWKPDGAPLFAARIEGYLAGAGRARGPQALTHFEKAFADGREGRPTGFDEFLPLWQEWLKGHYWQSRASWIEGMNRPLKHRGSDLVQDPRIWHDDRGRAEPAFGQDHAFEAGLLLAQHGDPALASEAFAWSLEVDELDPVRVERIATHWRKQGTKSAALALEAIWHRRGGPAPSEDAPLTGRDALLAHLKDLAQAADQGGRAERWLRAEHARLAPFAGQSPFPRPAEAPGQGLDAPPEHLALTGFFEDRLTQYEERRVPNLWFVDERGDLTVGLERPRAGVTGRDRRAHQRDAFARSALHLAPGRYRLEFRLHPETSYVSGAFVFGGQRRDRDHRLHWSGGDFLYSIGVSEEAPKFERMHLHLAPGRAREGALPGVGMGLDAPFQGGATSIQIRLDVEGAHARVAVDGKIVGHVGTHDGRPIEGSVGFAASQGAYRISGLRVRRLDRAAWAEGPSLMGLTLTQKAAEPSRDLRHRPTGLATSKEGALWIIVPRLKHPNRDDAYQDEATHLDLAFETAKGLAKAVDRREHALPIYVAIPRSLGEAARQQLVDDLARETKGRIQGVELHDFERALDQRVRENAPPEDVPTIAFIDPRGVLRMSAVAGRDLPGELRTWVMVFRSRPEDRPR